MRYYVQTQSQGEVKLLRLKVKLILPLPQLRFVLGGLFLGPCAGLDAPF